jgi:hypothetical protein
MRFERLGLSVQDSEDGVLDGGRWRSEWVIVAGGWWMLDVVDVARSLNVGDGQEQASRVRPSSRWYRNLFPCWQSQL